MPSDLALRSATGTVDPGVSGAEGQARKMATDDQTAKAVFGRHIGETEKDEARMAPILTGSVPNADGILTRPEHNLLAAHFSVADGAPRLGRPPRRRSLSVLRGQGWWITKRHE